MKSLRIGEYDLVNISLIGFDPISGRSFEDCRDEWQSAYKQLLARITAAKWWHVHKHIPIWKEMVILQNRLGAPLEMADEIFDVTDSWKRVR